MAEPIDATGTLLDRTERVHDSREPWCRCCILGDHDIGDGLHGWRHRLLQAFEKPWVIGLMILVVVVELLCKLYHLVEHKTKILNPDIDWHAYHDIVLYIALSAAIILFIDVLVKLICLRCRLWKNFWLVIEVVCATLNLIVEIATLFLHKGGMHAVLEILSAFVAVWLFVSMVIEAISVISMFRVQRALIVEEAMGRGAKRALELVSRANQNNVIHKGFEVALSTPSSRLKHFLRQVLLSWLLFVVSATIIEPDKGPGDGDGALDVCGKKSPVQTLAVKV